jgi:hypothetical protein
MAAQMKWAGLLPSSNSRFRLPSAGGRRLSDHVAPGFGFTVGAVANTNSLLWSKGHLFDQ